MKAYWAIFSMRSRNLFQYRTAVLAGVATQIFWGLIRIMIFGAFFATSSVVQPLSYAEVVTYTWISQALIALLPWGVDRTIAETIASGQVAYELVRPMDLHASWFARSLAVRGLPMLMRATVLLLFTGIFLGLQPPSNLAAALACASAVFGAWLLSAAITNFMSVTLLWTISGEGVNRLMPAFVNFFSGNILPLAFFPDWSQPIVRALPFRGLVDTPCQFYLGRYSPAQLPQEFLFQLAWAAGFYFTGHCLVSAAKRRIVVQGG